MRSLLSLLLVCLIPPSFAALAGGGPPSLAPGSLLAVSGFAPAHTLVEFAPDGEILGQVALDDPTGAFGLPSGLTCLDGELWVSGGTTLHRLDPLTGQLSSGFTVTDGPTLTALCSDGVSLLVGEFTEHAFTRFAPDGALLGTISLDTPLFMAGADCDEEHLYVASHATGDVHVFDMTGTTVSVIEVDLPGDLTGISLTESGDRIWVATGTGNNEVHEYDFAGTRLRSFPGQLEGLMGLHAPRGGLFADGFEGGNTDAWGLTVPGGGGD